MSLHKSWMITIPDKPPDTPRQKIIAGILTALTFIIPIVYISTCNWDVSTVEEKTYDNIDAITYAQIEIEQHLVSPGSAEHPLMEAKVAKVNDSTFTVVSYVDSQNKFGAMLRTNYAADVHFYPSTDKYRVALFLVGDDGELKQVQ